MFTVSEQRLLLTIAREAIVAAAGGSAPSTSWNQAIAARRAGAFVSLHSGKELRGCVGNIQANEPVVEVVRHCAVAASRSDPRFNPVSMAEIPSLHIEISVLEAPEPLEDPSQIEIGRDGLIVEMNGRRGLLLPQVAVEWRWDRNTFLEQTCQKAGLPADAWRTGALVWRFEAEVFGEGD